MSSRPASRRLFVEGSTLESGTEVTLGDEASHYVSRVLRLASGDPLTVFDGRGGEFAATVSAVSQRAVVVRVGAGSRCERESPLSIHLVQGISRGERMDFVVQKATELGVARVTPVMTEFSVVRLDARKRDKRALHWMRIARSACEQSGRNRLPVIDAPRPFDDWLHDESRDGLVRAKQDARADESRDGLVRAKQDARAAEAAGEDRPRIVLQPSAPATLAGLDGTPAGVDLLVGPEGGLSERELERALAAGFVACGFGPRILRTETAAIAAIAVLQARWGDLWERRPGHE